jgi:Flp pilus assembly pilin Flp
MRKSLTGQSILDYTLLFAIVVAALLIMGYYIRNSISGKYRDTGDTFAGGEQYIPGQR